MIFTWREKPNRKMLLFCKIFQKVLLFVSSSLKRKNGFYMKRETKGQGHQTKRELTKKTAFVAPSHYQPLDPVVIQSLWWKWLQLRAPGCSLWVGPGTERSHWTSTLLREATVQGKPCSAFQGTSRAMNWGLQDWVNKVYFPDGCASFCPYQRDCLPKCCILLLFFFLKILHQLN